MTEKALELKLKKEVEKLGGLCLKLKTPGFTGIPDRLVLLPGGKVWFVEVKKPITETYRKRPEYRKRQDYVDKQLKDLRVNTWRLATEGGLKALTDTLFNEVNFLE